MNSESQFNNNIAQAYNEEYYERGLVTGISGYLNYTWMPELTIRMAHFIINELKLNATSAVLDFGCAKGYLVKALRLLNIPCNGVDISSYAINNADNIVKIYCSHVSGVFDTSLYQSNYDWMLAKDVFEHIPEIELIYLLNNFKFNVSNILAIIPLSENDHCGKYIIPAYDNDITHLIIKSQEWWINFFSTNGWNLTKFSNEFPGCKENWTSKFPRGNGFFYLTRSR